MLAALLYVVGLNRSGYANAYYSAAVLAATKSWKAFFFGFGRGQFNSDLSGGAPPSQDRAPAGGPDGRAGLGNAQADSALIAYLESHQGSATWIVAVNGANEAASIELATGKPVIAMGGFLGSDPVPTLAQLEALVKSGQLRYVLITGQGGGLGGAGSSTSQSITSWIVQHGKQVSYGGSSGETLYDLAGAAG